MILCKVCNQYIKSLGCHIYYKHNMKIIDYLDQYPNSDIGRIKQPLEILVDLFGKTNAIYKFSKRNNYKKGSLKYYQCIYGNELGLSRYQKRNKNASKTLSILKPGSKDNLRKLYKDDLDKKLEIRTNKQKQTKINNKTGTLEGYIKKHGEEIGRLKYKEFINKCKIRFTEKRFIEMYGYDEGIEKLNNFKNKSKQTIDNFILRYGKKEGSIKYNLYINRLKQNSYFTIHWWISKYGKVDGKKKYKEFQTRNLLWWINKYGENEGKRLYKEWIKKCTSNNNRVSKESKLLFENIKIDNIEFEKQIDIYRPDCIYNNKIIEYYGTHWHADPRFYQPDDIIEPLKLTSKQIWEKDLKRNNVLKDNGFDIMIIWAFDFFNDQGKTINKCYDFLSGVNND